jgi:lysophospholipase L1-like esterase
MKELILLGDSIFDNAAYVAGGPDVCRQVGERLPRDWRATLLARDGSITADVLHQLQRLPGGATHLVISTGGNDAINRLALLGQGVASVGQALDLLWEVAARFRAEYRDMLEAALSWGLPSAVCTIYHPFFEDLFLQRAASAGLAFFNEAILLEATRCRVPVLDLRLIFTEPEDYANPVEPSVAGGAKLADAICRLFRDHDFSTPQARIYF